MKQKRFVKKALMEKTRPMPKKPPIVHDVPSRGAPKGGFTRPFKVLVSISMERKLLRMTLTERTRFVEFFSGFSDSDWRRFKRWIKKLKGEKS